jgi:hypothetical protein
MQCFLKGRITGKKRWKGRHSKTVQWRKEKKDGYLGGDDRGLQNFITAED